jgi:hypothetical protein
MYVKSIIPENTHCDLRDSWNIISKLSDEFWVVVHWPTWCENEFFYNNKISHSYSFSTKLNEMDVTMWSSYDKLYSKVEYILNNVPKIKVLFILGTCSSELIWDDIDSVKENFDTDVKIIIIHTSWMRWAWYHYTKYNIFKSLFNIFNNTEKFTKLNKDKNFEKSINIFFQDGVQNDNFRKEIKQFLSLFWIKVNSFLNSNITLKELETINKVSYNYVVWKDKDFITLLGYIKDKYNIPYKTLVLPVWFKNINKFYYTIYSDFFLDKKNYIVEFLKFKNNINKRLDLVMLSKNFNKKYFITNFDLYLDLLEEIWLNMVKFSDFYFYKSINLSHKFNTSNKIIITNNKDKILWDDLFQNKSFDTINKFMWFNWVYNFYLNIKNQFYYNNFLKRYNKYF